MADDELLPSAPEPDEPEPADRFSYEIEELIAERQALQTIDPNAWTVRRSSWDDMTLVFAQARQEVWAQRLDFTVAGLAIISLIGCALLLFALIGGEQTPVPSHLLSLTTPTSQSSPNTAVQSVTTPTADAIVSATPTHIPQPTPALLIQPIAPTATPTLPTLQPTPQPTATPRPQPTATARHNRRQPSNPLQRRSPRRRQSHSRLRHSHQRQPTTDAQSAAGLLQPATRANAYSRANIDSNRGTTAYTNSTANGDAAARANSNSPAATHADTATSAYSYPSPATNGDANIGG